MASRLAGHQIDRVLVDVTPYSFGVSFLGERGGVPYPHCYKPIIRRNSPLPVTRTERFYTAHPYQEEIDVQVYEGEDEDALRNILIGDYRVTGLTPMRGNNEVLCRMSLDLDGILNVTSIEKKSGLSKHITIARALEAKSEAEIAAARKRLEVLFATRQNEDDLDEEDSEEELLDSDDTEEDDADVIDAEEIEGEPSSIETYTPSTGSKVKREWSAAEDEGHGIIERSRRLLDQVHAEDREEVIDLNQAIEAAIEAHDAAKLQKAIHELRELLFFVEGRA
jgi:molecular chaperone DnaK (HSP70)